MTQTTQQILNEVFVTIGVASAGRAPSATQSNIALTIMNDNLLTQMRDGWRDLGWYPQTPAQLNNSAPLKDEDIGDIKLCVAAWVAPRFGRKIEPSPDPNDPTTLYGQIKDAFRRLNKRYLRQTESDLGELSRPQGGPWGGPNFL